MKLKEIYNKQPVISLEIFPPKATNGQDLSIKINELMQELKILSKFNPAFVSVTYGAGGSTRETTLELVLKIQNDLKMQPMPHFTCVGSDKTEILQYLRRIQDAGIQNILALRGDPPKGEEKFIKPKDGFGYANELVTFITQQTNLSIAVAGYPEGHQECSSLELDIENLKRKIDCGADVVLTQLFYDNDCYFNFIDKVSAKGIETPIVPGILPITSTKQIERIISLSGCKIPKKLQTIIDTYKDSTEDFKKAGINFAIEQCQELIDSQVPGIHFYTLNKSFATEKVLQGLNITQKI